MIIAQNWISSDFPRVARGFRLETLEDFYFFLATFFVNLFRLLLFVSSYIFSKKINMVR